MKMKNDTEDYNSLEDEENLQKNLIEEEEADDEFSETSSSTDYEYLEQQRIQRKHSFAWKFEDRTTMNASRTL